VRRSHAGTANFRKNFMKKISEKSINALFSEK
jgi:hypothetical protein